MKQLGRFGAVAVTTASLAAIACGQAGRPATASAASPAVAAAPGLYAVTAAVPAAEHLVNTPPPRLAVALANLQSGFRGKVGIAVRAVDAGWTAEAGGRRLLPQQSVSKLWVAMTVLDAVDAGRMTLDDPVVVRSEDLTLFHQPIAGLVKGDGYHTTIGDLLRRSLTHSDNTANDKLLHVVGGPAAVRGFIARRQLGEIRFGPGERLLQSRTAGLTWRADYAKGNTFMIARSKLSPAVRAAALDRYVADPPDGAAPLAIADALGRLARGELLSAASTDLLIRTMGESVTGRARLRAALPAGWRIAHKTGTGQDLGARNAGFNDVGLLTAPDGTRFAIAVMIGDSSRPTRERQQLIQSVAAAVARYEEARSGTETTS